MPGISAFASVLHVLAAIVWVGGMFFAYMVLRPSLGVLEPPQRPALWNTVFPRFFAWVWVAVIALPVTGYAMVFGAFGGFADAGVHVHVMHALGWVMIALFVFLYAVPFRRFQSALAGGGEAGKHLTLISRIVAVNLVLGLITSAVAAWGRFAA